MDAIKTAGREVAQRLVAHSTARSPTTPDHDHTPTSPSTARTRAPIHRSTRSDASTAGVSLTSQRIPTGLAAEPLNVVILGASFGGLSCAHHFLDYTIGKLRTTSTAPSYRLVIVSPSTHIFWNIGAPRALVKAGLIKHEDAFIPIEPGFHRHRGHLFTLVQGEAVSLDTDASTVTLELFSFEAQKRIVQILPKRALQSPNGPQNWSSLPKRQTIPYHALICCTGSSAHSDLLSLHGPHVNTIAALDAFHDQAAHAHSIVICGGGCSGVETAGQLATWLNHRYPVRGLPCGRRVKHPKQIILITGGARCLPHLPAKLGARAEAQLRRLGVDVRHHVRVLAATAWFDQTGATKVDLSDHTMLIADLYVACTGVTPNADYAPPRLRDPQGYIRTDAATLRVEGAGPRVYAVGDVASYSQNYVLDVYAAIPVAMHNLFNDLLTHELRLASPYGGNQDVIAALEDEKYVPHPVDSQLCPISRFGGVGMIVNHMLPKVVVHLLKGHDYRVCKAKRVVVDGGNPYAVKNQYE